MSLKVKVKDRVLIDNIKKYWPASEITDDGILEVTDCPGYDDCYKTKCRHAIYKSDCQVIEEVKEPLQTPTGNPDQSNCFISFPNGQVIQSEGKPDIIIKSTDVIPAVLKNDKFIVTMNGEEFIFDAFSPYIVGVNPSVMEQNADKDKPYTYNPDVKGLTVQDFLDTIKPKDFVNGETPLNGYHPLKNHRKETEEPINGGSNLGTPIFEEAGKTWVKEAEEKKVKSLLDITLVPLYHDPEKQKVDNRYYDNQGTVYEKINNDFIAVRMFESENGERFENVSLTNKGDNSYSSENEVAEWIKQHEEKFGFDKTFNLCIWMFYYWMKGGNR